MLQWNTVKISVLRHLLGLAILLLPGAVVDATEFKTELITLTDVAAPDGMGTIVDLAAPVLNDSGQVAFGVRYLGSPSGIGPFGLLLSEQPGDLVTIARTGDIVPDGNGRLSNVGTFPLLNNAGQVTFKSDLFDFTGPLLNDEGIFLGSVASSLQQRVRAGDPTPDGNGIIADLVSLTDGMTVLNDAGQVAFRGFLSSFSRNDSALFLSNGPGDLLEIARTGDVAPDGLGNFQGFGNFVSLNDAGQAAFRVTFTDTGSNENRNGVFRRDSTGELVQNHPHWRRGPRR